MNQAIDMLMNEHRVIERVLGSLETFAIGLEGEPEERAALKDFVDFFANFADRCHHGKEEDRLFRVMVAGGLPREQGPIAVMLAEHAAGREHVQALRAIGAGAGPLTESERVTVREHAFAYVSLLRDHIQKEDTILYPMAFEMLPAAEFEAMAGEFEEFERTVMGAGEHERFHGLAGILTSAYPAVASDGGDCATCAGCGHF